MALIILSDAERYRFSAYCEQEAGQFKEFSEQLKNLPRAIPDGQSREKQGCGVCHGGQGDRSKELGSVFRGRE